MNEMVKNGLWTLSRDKKKCPVIFLTQHESYFSNGSEIS